jgi:hypothetical protein
MKQSTYDSLTLCLSQWETAELTEIAAAYCLLPAAEVFQPCTDTSTGVPTGS